MPCTCRKSEWPLALSFTCHTYIHTYMKFKFSSSACFINIFATTYILVTMTSSLIVQEKQTYFYVTETATEQNIPSKLFFFFFFGEYIKILIIVAQGQWWLITHSILS